MFFVFHCVNILVIDKNVPEIVSSSGMYNNTSKFQAPKKELSNMPKWLIPSRVSGRGYKIGPVCVCVCVCVCQLVSALTAEPFDLRT